MPATMALANSVSTTAGCPANAASMTGSSLKSDASETTAMTSIERDLALPMSIERDLAQLIARSLTITAEQGHQRRAGIGRDLQARGRNSSSISRARSRSVSG